jgi:hypothetical protein
MNASKEQLKMTAGLDIGDKYSYLCLIDQESGEVVEEGRLRTTPEALRRRFASEQPPMRIAMEAGTHSPWVSRVLKECGHEVLVAAALLGILLGVLGLLVGVGIALHDLGRAVGHVSLLWILMGAFSLLAFIAIAVGLLIFVKILRD